MCCQCAQLQQRSIAHIGIIFIYIEWDRGALDALARSR